MTAFTFVTTFITPNGTAVSADPPFVTGPRNKEKEVKEIKEKELKETKEFKDKDLGEGKTLEDKGVREEFEGSFVFGARALS